MGTNCAALLSLSVFESGKEGNLTKKLDLSLAYVDDIIYFK